MEEFHWTPDEVDAIDPKEFDKITYALEKQKEIRKRNYDEYMAKLGK